MKHPFVLLFLVFVACSPPPEQTSINTQPSLPKDSLPDSTEINLVTEEKIIPPDYDTTQWTELITKDSSIILDLRYATTNNFVKEQMYDCGRCFLRPEVANAVLKFHRELQQEGLGLKFFDCFRPRPIQWKLWEKVPDPRYVSDPRKGSMHNRGAAIDLTIVDHNGKELNMGTDFDFFGKKAYQNYEDLPEEVLANRKLLREGMQTVGFSPIRTEWWHYSYQLKSYEISDMVWDCPE